MNQPATKTFSTLTCSPLAQAIAVLGFARMTPVQEHACELLAGRDVIAQARTGSGKTVAFGLALLARTDVSADRVQVLVLCPTRELADQVSTEVRRLARFIPNLRVVTLCGGVPVRTQTPSLQTAPHVSSAPGTNPRSLVARRSSLKQGVVLDKPIACSTWVLRPSTVIEQAPADRQTLLFSATYRMRFEP
jgi:ATP-independent RNA helicase DbpA